MILEDIFTNKTLKPKEKTEAISKLLLGGTLSINNLVSFATLSKDPIKATCIESIEFATKINPTIANKTCFDFVVNTLTEKAPRVKWESAKVIANTAHLFPMNLKTAIVHLLSNTEHPGTVVRWSAAFALAEIIKLNTADNKKLIPAIKNIMEQEEKNSIKKIYEAVCINPK